MMDLKTCRFCKQSNYDFNHPNVHSFWIKYSTRHSAHLSCIVKAKGGEQLIKDLPTWVLEKLPFFEVRDLGLEKALREELARRKLAVVVTPAAGTIITYPESWKKKGGTK